MPYFPAIDIASFGVDHIWRMKVSRFGEEFGFSGSWFLVPGSVRWYQRSKPGTGNRELKPQQR
jgi:hypothetical protein